MSCSCQVGCGDEEDSEDEDDDDEKVDEELEMMKTFNWEESVELQGNGDMSNS